MLLNEFDFEKNAIINPNIFKQKDKNFPKIAVGFFSKKLIRKIVEQIKPEIIGNCENANSEYPVYKINTNIVDIAVFHAAVGAPAIAGQVEELIAYGVNKILLVGCCGCLDSEIEEYSLILPTQALRDEGVSYHYMQASDLVDLDKKMIKAIEKTLISLNLNYRKGITWTTDAFYRETPQKVNRRKKQGAIVVEMECASVASVAKFRKIRFAQIFYAADSLGGEEYEPRSLVFKTNDFSKKEKIIGIAFECANEISKI